MQITSAQDQVQRRSLDTIVAEWERITDRLPSEFSYDGLFDHIELTFLTALSSPIDENLVLTNADAKLLCLQDALFLAAKASHAIRVTKGLLDGRKPTFAYLNAFTATMLLSKAILAFCGVHVGDVQMSGSETNGRDKTQNLLIDTFPWMGTVDQQKKFKRNNPDWKLSLRICKINHRIEHKHIWTLFQRVLRVVDADSIGPNVIQRLARLDYSTISPRRNKVMYDNLGWVWPDDLVGTMDNGVASLPTTDLVKLLDEVEARDDGIFLLSAVLHRMLIHMWFALSGVATTPLVQDALFGDASNKLDTTTDPFRLCIP